MTRNERKERIRNAIWIALAGNPYRDRPTVKRIIIRKVIALAREKLPLKPQG